MIDFPIGTLSYKQPTDAQGQSLDELVFSVETFDATLGKVVPMRLTPRTSSKHGFPTPKEEQMLVCLLLLMRLKNNFSEPRVEFRAGELFPLMAWPHYNSSRRQLQTGLNRLNGVKLKYENSWTTRGGDQFAKVFHTGILDSYQLTTHTSGTKDADRELNWVQWSAEVFADIRSSNVKELNTTKFFSLRFPLARRMYRFLDNQLQHAPHVDMDLPTFSCHLGISETEHVGKIKERLYNSVIELESLPGFIAKRRGRNAFIRGDVVHGGSASNDRTPLQSHTEHHRRATRRNHHRTQIRQSIWCVGSIPTGTAPPIIA